MARAVGDRDYHHPYTPYDIQLQFMSNLYECLEQRQVGIFESPTGTGKSLSIICGALTWLRDHQRKELEGGAQDIDDDEPDWIVEHAKSARLKRAADAQRDLEARLANARAEEAKRRRRFEQLEPASKRVKRSGPQSIEQDDEADFLLDDYESDQDEDRPKAARNQYGFSDETLKLLEKAGMLVKEDNNDENPFIVETKLFFCSRTHSQLAQFASEVRRVRIPPEVGDVPDKDLDKEAGRARLISLGARKNLCINSEVASLGSATSINERCLELQQPKVAKDQKCQHLPGKGDESLISEFRDLSLAKVRDIEDLALMGKQIGICPYYASRAAIPSSELVTLPYPLLLQKSAREALEISLKGQIIIIDEAHNLMDAVESIYSSSVSLQQLQQARSQLGLYLQKFRNKLKGKNRVYVAQVVRLIDSLAAYLQKKQSSGSKEGVVDMTELMSGKGADQVNLHKLCRYLQESKLARKVAGYALAAAKEKDKGATTASETPTLMVIESFFLALTNLSAEGKFFYEQNDGEHLLKYMLLDPAHHFREVVEEARAVVLAGGTMSPMDDYVNHLFPYVDQTKIRKISCGHVIPEENLFACPLTATAKISFDFTFDKRNSPVLLDELGKTVISLSKSIPDGLVIFFPSYQYLDQVVKAWSRSEKGSNQSLFDVLKGVKPVFQEHKGINVDKLLHDHGQAINHGKGALLLSVIGGKLSEGINFSDRLGRGVVVVGLPFPNAQSIGWKTKLDYIERSTVKRGGTLSEGKLAAKEFYENACMRAVNQSVGRAIRHKGDYACIVLLDRRYASQRIQAKLPSWIKGGFSTRQTDHDNVEVALNGIRSFFRRHDNTRALPQR